MQQQLLREKPETLKAGQILGIAEAAPEFLFFPDEAKIKDTYRRLVKKWHPDRCKDAEAPDVIVHLNKLHDSAKKKLEAGDWQNPGYFAFRALDGKTYRVRSDKSHAFELGTLHVGPTTATFVVGKEFADLFSNAKKIITQLKFADDKMKKAYAPLLPTKIKTYETADAHIMTVQKGSDYVLLRDLEPLLEKNQDRSKHVAWIVSRLHGLARYLDHIGLTHNAITLDTVFVSPAGHSAALLGGWWFAAAPNGKLAALHPDAVEFVSDDAYAAKSPEKKVDLEMIRAAGRELLGDRGGTRLTMLKAAPQGVIDYLRLPTSGDAQQDLSRWQDDVLKGSFGARRFTVLPVTYSDVYQPGG